jgi:pyruvate/2-oxoglutarate dehydrogenase complex dihydrolipoamide dehydrogenase (E3) component
VTVVEAQSRLLPLEEPEASDPLMRVLATEGLEITGRWLDLERLGAGVLGVPADARALPVHRAWGCLLPSGTQAAGNGLRCTA